MGHTNRLHGVLVPFEDRSYSVTCPQCGRTLRAYKLVYKNDKLIKVGECGHELPEKLFAKPGKKSK